MILYIFLVGIIGSAASGLPIECKRDSELLPNASYCGWSNSTVVSFICINGNVNYVQECKLGCLNGVCQQNDPAICSLGYYMRINPSIAGDCWNSLSSRSDAVDVRLDYSYATNLATVLARFFVGDLNRQSPCYKATFELACNIAYPSCSLFNQCGASFAAAITACKYNLTDIDADFCSYQQSPRPPDIFDKLLTWGLVALAICVGLVFVALFIIYYRKLHMLKRTNGYTRAEPDNKAEVLQEV